ncbi:helix-turn-helix domain-containing protein [Halobacteriovorax sp.]|uniref:helix-turn-helix domain-containing protein n=1 Tax=Halobacteriovorax sp. TaxID=2020862 RepID=UPI003565B5C7
MRKRSEQRIIRKQVQKKLESFSLLLVESSSITSFSRYIRGALGMSLGQLSARLGVAPSTASELEKREEKGNITLNRLRDLADALECDVQYTFVPRKSIQEIVEDQAKKKSIKSMSMSDTHMSLEDQKVTTDFETRLEDLVDDYKYSKYLWDSDD